MKKIFTWQNILAVSLFIAAVLFLVFSNEIMVLTIIGCCCMTGSCVVVSYIFYSAFSKREKEYLRLKAEFISVLEERWGYEVDESKLENTNYSVANEKKFYNKINYFKYGAIFFAAIGIWFIYEVISILVVI